MDEITSAISESISDLPGSEADTSVDTSTDVSSAGSAPLGDTSAGATDHVDGDAPPPETDPTTGQPVQRPMSRSQKRITQLVEAQKAAEAKYQAEIAERDERMQSLAWAQEPQAKAMWDGMQLMLTDKQRFVKDILLQDPEYQNLIAIKEAQAAAAQEQAHQIPDFPEPDAIGADGALAHSPEAFHNHIQAVADSVARRVAAEVRAETAKEMAELRDAVKPFVTEAADKKLYEAKKAENGAAFDRIAKIYGQDAIDLKEDMHTWLKGQWAQNKRAGLNDAVENVLVPAVIKARNEARAGLLSSKDTAHARSVAAANTDAAAADRAAVAGGRAVAGGGDEIEDAIRGAIAGLSR